MPISDSVNYTVKQLQTVRFWLIFSIFLCNIVDLSKDPVDELVLSLFVLCLLVPFAAVVIVGLSLSSEQLQFM